MPENRDRIALNAAFARRHIAAVNEQLPRSATWRMRGVMLIDAVFHRFRPRDRNPPRYEEQ